MLFYSRDGLASPVGDAVVTVILRDWVDTSTVDIAIHHQVLDSQGEHDALSKHDVLIAEKSINLNQSFLFSLQILQSLMAIFSIRISSPQLMKVTVSDPLRTPVECRRPNVS